MIRVGIVGGTGYTGGELLRLLGGRGDVEIAVVTSRELQGAAVAGRFPQLRGYVELRFAGPDDAALKRCDVVFFATPHGVAMHHVGALLEAGVRVIDLSADFRLRDMALWERWYKTRHASPHLAAEAVYGLPETQRKAIAGARLVAAPGCYPTAIQLGLLPMLEAGLADTGRLIADAKSGLSGAGRRAVEDYLLCEAADSVKAYGLDGHRHHPEICQQLTSIIAAGDSPAPQTAKAPQAPQTPQAAPPVTLTFVPHLVPMPRGILATLYAPIKDGMETDAAALQALYEARYAAEPFVRVLPPGELPATRHVKGSNICEVAVAYAPHSRTAVALSAEDNLVKGAAGQAVQCMNIMFGLAETAGLQHIALLP